LYWYQNYLIQIYLRHQINYSRIILIRSSWSIQRQLSPYYSAQVY